MSMYTCAVHNTLNTGVCAACVDAGQPAAHPQYVDDLIQFRVTDTNLDRAYAAACEEFGVGSWVSFVHNNFFIQAI